MGVAAQLLNTVLSLFWTAVFLGPVYLFCAHHLPLSRTIAFLVAGTASMLLPRSALQRLTLSHSRTTYERLGVPSLIHFTQDAAWLRRMSGSSQPRARCNQASLQTILRDTWVRERFHLGLCTFCILCSVAAALQRQLGWLTALIGINILYNIYPILLQQYLRQRITRCQRHFAG